MGVRLLALIALKVIKILAFLAKHENSFDVPRVACDAPATPHLSPFTGGSYHTFVRARRAAAVTGNRARGNAKPLLVKTESQQ